MMERKNEKNDTRSVSLTLTESCNLACVYCYEHNKNAKVMSIETAKGIIDRELNDVSAPVVAIDFFGGEPFLEFERMRELVEYISTKKWPVKVKCSTCTNGTLIHGNIQEWLYENRENFVVGLSLDGTKAMHDYNRSNSFDSIDLEFFRKCWPGQTVKMTVSPYSLRSLAKGVIFIHEMGFNVACNLAYGVDWNDPENVEVLEHELFKLIEYYMNHPTVKPCTMLSMGIEYVDGSVPNEIAKWCGSGNYMHTYDVDGNVYPCQFFMPLSVGTDKAKKLEEIDILSSIPVSYMGEECAACPFVHICPTCIGSNYSETGELYAKSNSVCKCMKVIIAANSYFKWLQVDGGYFDCNLDQKNRILRGIQVVQSHLFSATD